MSAAFIVVGQINLLDLVNMRFGNRADGAAFQLMSDFINHLTLCFQVCSITSVACVLLSAQQYAP
jgi:hypothetical protein